jgi:hypothetical protein
MSGMEPMIIGAVAGAATNRDDPFKGALMGAALGGLGGGLLGNAAGAAGGAAEGAVGASELGALARPDVAPVLSDYITQAQAAGQVPMAGIQVEPVVRSMGGADLSWMDRISPSQQAAIEAGKLPGSFQMPSLGGAMSALSQAQPRSQMPSPGGLRRGQPQSVNYGDLAGLLEPKLVERRRLSLL